MNQKQRKISNFVSIRLVGKHICLDQKLEKLSEKEKEILCGLSVLPSEPFSIPALAAFFYIEEAELPGFFDLVHDLSTKHILFRNGSAYFLKEADSQYIRHKLNPGIQECSKIVNYFIDKLDDAKLDYEKGFVLLYNQLSTFLELVSKNSLHIANLSYVLSCNFMHQGNYTQALKYNQMALDISEKIDHTHPLVAHFCRDRANIHNKLGEPEKAIFYGLKDIEILEMHQGKYDDYLPDSCFTLSKTYEGVQNLKKAVEYNLKAIKYEQNRSASNLQNLCNMYHNLASYYARLNNIYYAKIYINKAVETISDAPKKDIIAYNYLIKYQKKINSIYEIEKLIRKYRFPIIFGFATMLGLLIWCIILLITR
jgi:hypothetical protein